jgi:hypothetical protein
MTHTRIVLTASSRNDAKFLFQLDVGYSGLMSACLISGHHLTISDF